MTNVTLDHKTSLKCLFFQIEIYTFTFTFTHLADAFIQSDLQLHLGYTFSLVSVFPGNRTHNLLRCWRNALPLSQTGTLLQIYPWLKTGFVLQGHKCKLKNTQKLEMSSQITEINWSTKSYKTEMKSNKAK